MITAKHPVRSKLAGLSSSNNYYATKGAALQAADEVLKEYGWTTGVCNPLGDEGRELVAIGPADDEGCLKSEEGLLAFSWYRMPSGRYEIVMYLA